MSILSAPSADITAALVLADGRLFWGKGIGVEGEAVGELCFNTAMTGYQEILTDPSYAGQMICFTFPHIGNVGCNDEDFESARPAARGFVLHDEPTAPSNWRAEIPFADWAAGQGLVGIAGVDTRALTRHIRKAGAPNAVIAHRRDGRFDIGALLQKAQSWPGLEGMDLAREVTCKQPYEWTETLWSRTDGYGRQTAPRAHIVAIDYGIKRNILRNLAQAGARVTVVPADTDAATIRALEPDGIFLSNGPGDPAATGVYAIPVIKALLADGYPIFGICLGHQMLGLALGGRTIKMHQGHRGANHPVKELKTGRVMITAMNHGFALMDSGFADSRVRITERSLFDGTVCGLALEGAPVFSVQQHPEASPGPQDSYPVFARFLEMAIARKAA
ncbi:MAG: glutamine-hydrolyzing carbamoyl-phosphate synthase small subunit [Rhodothalassiaceae bacterium]